MRIKIQLNYLNKSKNQAQECITKFNFFLNEKLKKKSVLSTRESELVVQDFRKDVIINKIDMCL